MYFFKTDKKLSIHGCESANIIVLFSPYTLENRPDRVLRSALYMLIVIILNKEFFDGIYLIKSKINDITERSIYA